jgi:WD40 repeat protein
MLDRNGSRSGKMSKSQEDSSNPPSYPQGGSYAELLNWHLDIWGTRPDGNLEKCGEPWVHKKFAALVHEEGTPPENAEKNLRNWCNPKRGPPASEFRVKRIEEAFFGTNPLFERWKNDLRLARLISKEDKSPSSIESGISEQSGAPPPSVSSQHAVPTPANPITVPHNDTPFIPPQIPVEIVRVDEKILWSAGDDLSWKSVSFSPMGDRIVAACDYQGVWLLDAFTGNLITKLAEHKMADGNAVFSPDGLHVVIRTGTLDLTLLDVGNSVTKAKYRGHAATFSPDGSQLASLYLSDARIWDAETGASIATLRGHQDSVYSAAFSPNGRFIVTASADRTAIVWNTATDFIVQTLKGHKDSIVHAVFSPDSLKIVTASADNSARIWSAKSGEELFKLEGHKSSVKNAAFSPDGRLVMTASYDSYARFWDAATGRCVGAIRDSKPVYGVAFSPCGNKVVTASRSGLRCFSLLIQAE